MICVTKNERVSVTTGMHLGHPIPKVLIILLIAVLKFVMPNTYETASICVNPNVEKQSLAGQHYFRQLVNRNRAFADKSLLMKDFVEHPAKVILVTCPRNWGKSMNMDMMVEFFRPLINKNGTRDDIKQGFNYKLFALGEAESGKITPMNIAKHQDFMDRYLGQHPVIYLDLNSAFSFDLKSLVRDLREIFEGYIHVFDTPRDNSANASGSQVDKKAAEAYKVLLSKFQRYKSTEKEALEGLKVLSECIHEYFGKKPFIFLDDYDKVINRKEKKESANRRVELLRQFLGKTFAENNHFEKGFVLGVMNLEIPRIFSGIPGFKHFNAIRNDFFRYFGLTEGEVALFLEACEIKGQTAADVKKQLGGYAVTNDAKASLYNIQSVHAFLRTKGFGQGLQLTENSYRFCPLFCKEGMKQVLAPLVNKTSIAIELNDLSFTVDDYHTLFEMLRRGTKVTETGINAFMRFILSEGFLTLDRLCDSSTLGRAYVTVPNEETANTLKGELKLWSWP